MSQSKILESFMELPRHVQLKALAHMTVSGDRTLRRKMLQILGKKVEDMPKLINELDILARARPELFDGTIESTIDQCRSSLDASGALAMSYVPHDLSAEDQPEVHAELLQ